MKYLLGRFLLVLILTVALVSPAYAISSQLRQRVQYDSVYYNPDATACTTFGVAGSSGGAGVWNSGLTPPYILQQFMVEVLKDIAQKANAPVDSVVTKEHVLAMVAFGDSEGGDINNHDLFNPLNSGYNDPSLISGAHSGSGVQSFKSFDAGVEATARNISDAGHTRLVAVLTNPNSTADDFMYALTYFQKYPGNLIWAEGSDPAYHNQGQAGQDAYYHRHLDTVQTVRAHYSLYGALVLGTPAKEQIEGLTDVAKLDPALTPNGADPGSSGGGNDISGSSGGCG